jgi:hypothetical protein
MIPSHRTPSHPGAVLRDEFLGELGIPQGALAAKLGSSVGHIQSKPVNVSPSVRAGAELARALLRRVTSSKSAPSQSNGTGTTSTAPPDAWSGHAHPTTADITHEAACSELTRGAIRSAPVCAGRWQKVRAIWVDRESVRPILERPILRPLHILAAAK